VQSDYSRNPWQDQSHYVEVWCEKDALSGIFSDALSTYGVTLNTTKAPIPGAPTTIVLHIEP
jgi:hypothetical protein